jgi:DNA polymerase-3 subunit alpha
MKDVERIGLVKFDFLGLTTLTVLDWAAQSISSMGKPDFELEKIPLDDPAAYQVFASANTTAIFQFESRGMRDLVKRARPDRFEDIIALVALYRPGPMELIPEFVERKNGKRVEYLDPRLEPILKPTYGIMVYQEQVMQIAQVMGGYSLGGADLLRRAMGKKDAKEMAQQRDIFVAGAEKNKLPRAKAILLFDLMEKFAGYGFNKSHAAAYALIAYQTAYLKAHYSAAFMAANLSAVLDDTDKVHQFYEDALANGLKVLAPDVNSGEYRFVPVDARTIRYGLGAVKGTGESAIAAILAARKEGGPFRDVFDFCSRVDKRAVNRRVVEALVRAGAFDFLDDGAGAHRASLLASVGVALEAAGQAERNAMQSSLFGAADAGAQHKPELVAAPRWTEAQRLREEKTSLGFYLSGHPFTEHRAEIGKFVKTSLKSLAASAETEGQRTQLIAGVVESIRFQRTQQGRMVVVILSDGTATQELTVYNEVFDQYRDLVKEDAIIVVEAKVRSVRRSVGEEGEAVFTRITAERIYDLAGARSRFARAVRLSMNGEASSAGAASSAKLKTLLEPYRQGQCAVEVRYRNGGASVEMQLGDNWRVNLDDALLQSLNEWLKPENVEVVYP